MAEGNASAAVNNTSPSFPSSSEGNGGGKGETQIIGRDELMNLLECPICRGVFSVPVCMCANGHSICGTCNTSLASCGLCRSKLTNTRNFFVEELLEKVKLECSNAAKGCLESVPGIFLKTHETKCDYRPVYCSLRNSHKKCTKMPIEYSKYFSHIRDVHRMASMDDEHPTDTFRIHFYDEDIFSWEEGFWPSVYYTFDSYVFIVRSSLANEEFSIWSSIIGTRGDAAKYRVNLTLFHHSASGGSGTSLIKRTTCGCVCNHSEEVTKSKDWKGCRVFTQHVQDYSDVEDGRSPLKISVDELPAEKVKISMAQKRKRNQTAEVVSSQLMHSWSISFQTVKYQEKSSLHSIRN